MVPEDVSQLGFGGETPQITSSGTLPVDPASYMGCRVHFFCIAAAYGRGETNWNFAVKLMIGALSFHRSLYLRDLSVIGKRRSAEYWLLEYTKNTDTTGRSPSSLVRRVAFRWNPEFAQYTREEE